MLKRTPIIPKAKPCKINDRSIEFSGCGTLQLERKKGLGIKCGCYYKFLANTPQGNAILNKTISPIKEARESFEQAKKERIDRNKLSYLLVNVKNVLHEYVRLRDYGLNCISCNGLWQSDHQCGHFYKSETFSTLRFDEKNLTSQCISCNIHNDGNESGYRFGIVRRYGEEHLKYLDDKAATDKQGTHKWDRQQLESIRKEYSKKLKQLKNDTTRNKVAFD